MTEKETAALASLPDSAGEAGPVAWLCTRQSTVWAAMPDSMTEIVREVFEAEGVKIEPLYTHPAPRPVGSALTDEDFYTLADSDECNPDSSGWGPKFSFLAFGRAVEAKLASLSADPIQACNDCEGNVFGCPACVTCGAPTPPLPEAVKGYHPGVSGNLAAIREVCAKHGFQSRQFADDILAAIDTAPAPITASLMRDDGGDSPAFCVMAAYRTEQEARTAFAVISSALATFSHPPATPAVAVQAEPFTAAEIDENPRLKFEPEQWIRRDDGKVVRVDRWEWGMRAIVSTLWGNRHEFEISEVVEAVEALAAHPKPAAPATADDEREFSVWLNDRRMLDVSEVFHEIVERYALALRSGASAQHAGGAK